MIEWDVTFRGLLQALNRETLSSVPGFKECDFCLFVARSFFKDLPISGPGPSSLELRSAKSQPAPFQRLPDPFE